MNQTQFIELMKFFEESELSRLEWEQDGNRVVLEKSNTTVESAPVPAPISASVAPEVSAEGSALLPSSDVQLVKAPLVGIFYSASSPELQPYVQLGQRVKKGDVLCLIEAMKMMSELTATVDGVVTGVLVQNEQMVEFDQPLFEVKRC